MGGNVARGTENGQRGAGTWHNCHRGLPVAVPLGQLALGFMCTTNKRPPQDKKVLKKCQARATGGWAGAKRRRWWGWLCAKKAQQSKQLQETTTRRTTARATAATSDHRPRLSVPSLNRTPIPQSPNPAIPQDAKTAPHTHPHHLLPSPTAGACPCALVSIHARWQPTYLATNRMKCRASQPPLPPCPRCDHLHLLPANRLRCRRTYPLAPPLRCVRQRHLGHIYQNILRIQLQKFAKDGAPNRARSPSLNHPSPLSQPMCLLPAD